MRYGIWSSRRLPSSGRRRKFKQQKKEEEEEARLRAKEEAAEERRTKNRFTRPTVVSKSRVDSPELGGGELKSLATVHESTEGLDSPERPEWWDDEGLEQLAREAHIPAFVTTERVESLTKLQLAAMNPGFEKKAIGNFLAHMLPDYAKWHLDLAIGCLLRVDTSLIMELAQRPTSLRWCMDRLAGGPLGEVCPPRAEGLSSTDPLASKLRRRTSSPFVGGRERPRRKA